MAEPSPPLRPYGVLPLTEIAGESGLAVLRRMLAGTLPQPPICATLGFRMVAVDDGLALFEGEPSPAVLNPLGTVHGGWSATLLDSALACAVHTTLRPGEAYTTVEFKVSLVRAIAPDSGRLRCEGRIVHRGSRLATSEARLTDAAGRLFAHGSETCMIFPAA